MIVYLFTIHLRDVIFIHLYLKVSILGEGNGAKIIVMSCVVFCDNRIKYFSIVVTPLPEAGEHPEE